jgi:hypothetical protein
MPLPPEGAGPSRLSKRSELPVPQRKSSREHQQPVTAPAATPAWSAPGDAYGPMTIHKLQPEVIEALRDPSDNTSL